MHARVAGGLDVGRCVPDQYSSWPYREKYLVMRLVSSDCRPTIEYPRRWYRKRCSRLPPTSESSDIPRKDRMEWSKATGDEGAIVAQLVSASGGRTRVEAVSPVIVIGLPCGIRGLEKNVRCAGIVADDKGNVTRPSGVSSDQPGNVHSRCCRRGDGPRSGLGPIAAIYQPCRSVGNRVGLGLGREAEGITVATSLAPSPW